MQDRAFRLAAGLVIFLVVAWGGISLWRRTNPPAGTVDIPHLHGLGFSADGEQLIVPAHDGLRIYTNGGWQESDVPAHDYMGYSPADTGFYSSGHPAPGSGLVNPLGLVKSADGGRTLTRLGLEGESDFHLMGVGYFSHAIYVFNPATNARLPVGMSVTLDDGQTWQLCALNGVTANPYQIAVHPTEAGVVALATEGGLFLSTDFGNTFTLVSPPELVTAAAFTPDGTSLMFGGTQLKAYDLASKQITIHTIPPLDDEEALTNLAINPQTLDEIALATSRIDIYLSSDSGQTWRQIASNGTGLP